MRERKYPVLEINYCNLQSAEFGNNPVIAKNFSTLENTYALLKALRTGKPLGNVVDYLYNIKPTAYEQVLVEQETQRNNPKKKDGSGIQI